MQVIKILKNFLKRFLLRRIVIEDFQDGEKFQVVDYKYIFNIRPSYRRIEFKDKDPLTETVTWMSSIYTDVKNRRQPYIPYIEDLFEKWGKDHTYKNVLVLGCAGCAFPRYFLLSYPNCKVTGIEYSEQMINVAKKYFLMDLDMSRFDLIKSDAFQWVRKYNGEPFDAIVVDLYGGFEQSKVFLQPEFIDNCARLLAPEGIIAFNVINGAEIIRKRLLSQTKWAGFLKVPSGQSTATAINCRDIKYVVDWKRKLLDRNYIWV